MRCLRFVFPLLVVLAAHSALADSVTKESFDAAARDYRIHVYETYRTQRAEYNRRMELAREVAGIWNKLDDASQQQEAFAWFAASEEAKSAPAVPEFVSNEALVIRAVKPKPSAEELTARQPKQPQLNSRPAWPGPSLPQTARKEKSTEKPGFFNALTKALVAKPKREVDAPPDINSAPEVVSSTNGAEEVDEEPSMWIEPTADAVAAEVDDTSEFGLDQSLSSDEEMELSSEVIRFNVDCNAVHEQLQDEAALDLERFSWVVSEIEELAISFVSLQQRLDAVPADRRSNFPSLQPTEELVLLAIERTQSPETWFDGGAVSEEDQETLSSLAGRLKGLLQD